MSQKSQEQQLDRAGNLLGIFAFLLFIFLVAIGVSYTGMLEIPKVVMGTTIIIICVVPGVLIAMMFLAIMVDHTATQELEVKAELGRQKEREKEEIQEEEQRQRREKQRLMMAEEEKRRRHESETLLQQLYEVIMRYSDNEVYGWRNDMRRLKAFVLDEINREWLLANRGSIIGNYRAFNKDYPEMVKILLVKKKNIYDRIEQVFYHRCLGVMENPENKPIPEETKPPQAEEKPPTPEEERKHEESLFRDISKDERSAVVVEVEEELSFLKELDDRFPDMPQDVLDDKLQQYKDNLERRKDGFGAGRYADTPTMKGF